MIIKSPYLTLLFFIVSSSLFAQVNKISKEELVGDESEYRFADTARKYKMSPEVMIQEVQKSRAKRLAKASSSSIFTSFEERGPFDTPGRASKAIIDEPHGIYLVGTSTGGLWKFHPDTSSYGTVSENSSTWTKINDFELSLSISDVIQDPFNYNTIYYSTGEHRLDGIGIFKSTDGGKTFNHLTNSSPSQISDFSRIYCIALHPTRQNELYVGAANGLYRSKDGGATFSLVLKAYREGWFGSGWGVNSIVFNASGQVIVSALDGGLFASSTGDNGTFSLITNTLPNHSDFSGGYYLKVVNCESQRNVLYAQFSNGVYVDMYKSTDGSVTWTKIAGPGTLISPSQIFHAHLLAVKPDDPNFIVSGSVVPAYSKDGGATWTAAYNFLGVDYQNAIWSKKNLNRVYLTSDHGIGFFMCDKMDQWGFGKDIGEGGLNTIQMYHGDYYSFGNGFVSGSQDNQCRSVLDQANESGAFTGGDGITCYVNDKNDNVSYCTTQGGAIKRCDSTLKKGSFFYYPYNDTKSILNELDANKDGRVDESHSFYSYYVLDPSDNDRIIFPTSKRLWVSKNKGDNWTQLSDLLNVAPYYLDPSFSSLAVTREPNPSVYLGRSNKLLRFDNIYNTVPISFVDLSSKLPSLYIDEMVISPIENDVLYVVDNFGQKFYKIDNAKSSEPTYVSIKGDMPEVKINCIAIHPLDEKYIFVGTDLGIYYSDNSGGNWYYLAEFPSVKVNHIAIRPSDQKFFIFTFGRGAWIGNFKTSVVTSATIPVAEEIKNESNIYPNPAHTQVMLKEFDDNTPVYIISLDGKVVKEVTQFNGTSISIETIPSGVNMVKYRSKNAWRYDVLIKQ